MASFTTQLPFFFLLVLLFLSPQIQAREGKFFSFFTHFKTINNVVKEHDKAESPTPTQEPILAPTQEPSSAPEYGSTGPAPEPEFLDNGEGYGLYGSDHSTQYPQSEETPTSSTTTNFGNQLLNQDFNEKSYKTGFPQTNFHNNNQEYSKNYNSEEYNNSDNNQEYTKNYNNEEYKNSVNNEGYTKNYNSEEYKNSINNEGYTKNYNSEEYKNSGNNEEYNTKNYNRETEEYNNNNNNGNEYYNTNNNNYGNGYEGKREGMSDTRFMENGKYYHNVNSENDQKNYKLNGYESGRGSNENYGEFQNEFDTMEEYEKQQEAQGYTYTP